MGNRETYKSEVDRRDEVQSIREKNCIKAQRQPKQHNCKNIFSYYHKSRCIFFENRVLIKKKIRRERENKLNIKPSYRYRSASYG